MAGGSVWEDVPGDVGGRVGLCEVLVGASIEVSDEDEVLGDGIDVTWPEVD